jgi:hypothetical protein
MAKFYCPFQRDGVISEECLYECEKQRWAGFAPCKDFPSKALELLEIIDIEGQDLCRHAWYLLRSGYSVDELTQKFNRENFTPNGANHYITPGNIVADFMQYIRDQHIDVRGPSH